MALLTFLLWVAIIGFVAWALVRFVPMPDEFKKLIIGVAIVGVVIWAIYVFLPSGGPYIGHHR